MPATPPSVEGLSVGDLVAVIRNDTLVYPLAGKVEVPVALEELKRRAFDSNRGDQGYARARLDELDLEGQAAANEEADRGEPDVLQPREDAAPLADVLRARGAEQAADDLERAAEVQAAGGQAVNGSVDEVLATNGFVAIRSAIMGVVAQADGLGAGAVDAAIAYASSKRRQAELAGQPRNVLDAVDAELAAFKAVRRFLQDLKAATERAKARASITGGL